MSDFSRPDFGLVLAPWKEQLLAQLAKARHRVYIISPYIKFNIASKVCAALGGKNVEVRTITRFRSDDFFSGASDIDAAWALSQFGTQVEPRFEIRFDNRLHAKIYVIDSEIAFVGSWNLTFSGLIRNYEAGIRTTDKTFIDNLCINVAELWESSAQISEDDFLAMTAQLRRQSFAVVRKDEHLYFTQTGFDLFSDVHEEGSRSDAWLSTDEFASPAGEQAAPLVTTLARSGALGSQPDALSSEESEAADSDIDSRQRLCRETLRRHDERLGEFLSQLKGRFRLDPGRGSTDYAAAITYPGVYGMRWQTDPQDPAPYSPSNFDPAMLYGERKEYLYPLGKSAFAGACFRIGLKAGILAKFGPSAVSTMVAAVGRKQLLAKLLDQNFLGPLLTTAHDTPSDEAYKRAAVKLIGAASLAEGLEKAWQIVEEFFNPLDLLGSDVMSVLAYKDPKTALQEASQRAMSKVPVYSEHVAQGPPHDPIWRCVVSVGNTITAYGEGSRKSEAEQAAAESALAKMTSKTGWQTILADLRDAELAKLRHEARHVVTPRLRLEDATRRLVEAAYESCLGIKVDPDYGYLALIDGNWRQHRHLPCDHKVLSYLGSSVLQHMLLTEAARLEKTSLPSGSLSRLAAAKASEIFRVRELRRSVGITTEAAPAALLDTVQAVVACLIFTCGASHAAESLAAQIHALFETAEETAVKVGEGKKTQDRALEITINFDPSVAYTQILQEYTQQFGGLLPSYSYHSGGVPHNPLYQAIAEYEGLQGRGTGGKKAEARNAAAFDLLLKLKKQLESKPEASQRMGAG